MSPRLELRLEQRLALTPELRTRLAILRMSPSELADELAREAGRNPFLLVESRSAGQAVTLSVEDRQTAHAAPFQDDLRRQIGRMALPERIAAMALLLISELGPDGLLDTDLATLAEEYALDEDELAEALTALQRCEPAGIGARTVGEALSLQLIDKGLSADQAATTVGQLAAFARQDWKSIATALGLSQSEARDRADLLRSLTAHPIHDDGRDAATILSPDLKLLRKAGEISVVPVDSNRPVAALDHAMVRKAETENFAPELLARARAMLAALEQRGKTLGRIGTWLAQTQAGFFDHGPLAMVPATQQDLAAELGLHPSTVSRALAGKAIDVDGRLWPLSIFFSATLQSAGGPVSARAVQRQIAELIAAEPAAKPLSDDAITRMLHDRGVDIARRTVAKYRQGLRIPPSSTRRRLAASKRGG
ncbi:RNA polymerase factor sigma-54 [Pararhodobacter zhoushanensis]|uniref:RNA polymerase factor sigma-54 n=1 Tax=Pararhodobacter zhoushanensis TaxID=2479545 RepID=UPI000F8E9C64|nr:hypothetical protein [Pararhodobacter zhoushanensis]